MSCGFFRGKQSRRMFEVKGDSTNVDSNVGIGGRGVKRRWGSREKVNASAGPSSWKLVGMMWSNQH
jgi:hypothetical protein